MNILLLNLICPNINNIIYYDINCYLINISKVILNSEACPILIQFMIFSSVFITTSGNRTDIKKINFIFSIKS